MGQQRKFVVVDVSQALLNADKPPMIPHSKLSQEIINRSDVRNVAAKSAIVASKESAAKMTSRLETMRSCAVRRCESPTGADFCG